MRRDNPTLRVHHRRIISRTKPPCAICGQHIDYSIGYPQPDSFVVDHIIPIHRGGNDTLDNKQAAHNRCNRLKSATTEYQHGVIHSTPRAWW